MFPIYALTRLLPIEMRLTGPEHDRALRRFGRLFPLRGIVQGPDRITLDGANKNEALLYYFFYNVLRYHRRTPLFRYLRTRLSHADVFLDIGANLGIYGYLAKKETGCETCLFEPEPAHLAFLRRNGHVFDRVSGVALSDRSGEQDLFVGDERHLTGSSLVMSDRGWDACDYSHAVRVECRRLDEIMGDAEWIDRIRLAKIDVEGAEEAVVRGMEGLLARNRFDIWCEVRGEQSDRNPGSYARVCGYLEARGYRPYTYDGYCLREFTQQDVRRVFDLLFLQRPFGT